VRDALGSVWREIATPYFKEDWKKHEITCRELNLGLSQYVRV
jgi:hypothetical protein